LDVNILPVALGLFALVVLSIKGSYTEID